MNDRPQNTLAGYFLTRAYAPGAKPFETIMELPPEEAESLTAKFTKNVSDKGRYYDHRRMVEDWLRTTATQMGTVIKNPHPLYFFLTTKPQAEYDPEMGMRYVSIPAEEVDLRACSFTIGDSFCNHQHLITEGRDRYGLEKNPFSGQVLGIENSNSILEGQRIIQEQRAGYVEIQMWDRPSDKFIPS